MKRIMLAGMAVMVWMGAGAMTAAAVPTKPQLKEQFTAREAELRDLKRQRLVGETIEGYVQAVNDTAAGVADVKRVVEAENRDRRDLYQILADEINAENPKAPVKATSDTIAMRNAARNIEKAEANELLRVAPDTWILAQDYGWHQKLVKYKTQGKIGETADGMVEAVTAADAGNADVSAVVREVNAARRTEYANAAAREGVSAAEIGGRMAARNRGNARSGEMFKDASGAWRAK